MSSCPMAERRTSSLVIVRIIPQSAFGQTVLLIGALLLINQVVSYLSVTYYFIRPSYQQMNSLVATQVKSVIGQDLLAANQSDRARFTALTDVHLLTEAQARERGLEQSIHYDFMSAQISQYLGRQVDARISTSATPDPDTPYYVWVQIIDQGNVWIAIPIYGLHDTNISPLTMYLMVIGLLSVAGGWIFVRRLNHPLQALQKAALQVGRGKIPPPLEEQGSTELIAVTRAFNRMNRGIQQLEKDRTVMVAGISHDLRTPLTRIRLASEMLPDDQEWIKDGIVNDIEDMNAIIDQFIDFARNDSQEQMEAVQLNDLVRELVSVRQVEASHIIDMHLTPLPLTKLRKIGIKRVLDNLIENAFRYGSEHIEVLTNFDGNSHRITCSVRDFGPGLREEELNEVFMPFTQGDKARGSIGSGLGLAITQKIMEMHSGGIRLHNHPDGGLVAEFWLPLH